MLEFEKFKNDLKAILNHYKNDDDVVKAADIKKFIDLVNDYGNTTLINILLKYIVYIECENKDITVKALKHFIQCHL